jgi:heme exporter protein D
MVWDKFFDMGGYAAYVWPAFSLSAVVLLVMLVVSLKFLKSQQRLLKQLESSNPDQARQTKT